MQIKFNILTIFTLLAGIASGQIDLEKEELKLNEELLNFRTEFTAAGMDKANISFASKMKDFLLLDGAYTYTFKHLETVAILDSPDGKIRIVNWNVEYPDFSYSFGGFVLHKNNKKVSIFELKDGQQFELENYVCQLHNSGHGVLLQVRHPLIEDYWCPIEQFQTF